MEQQGEIILYQPDESVRMEVRIEDETVWLTQAQIVELFQSSKANISEHLKNIYKSEELIQSSTVRNFRTVRQEGNRQITRNLEYYNLDVIISVGYRVNTKRGIQFRQWANSQAHDRFLIIDRSDVYHIGASLKDLGKKLFAFSKNGYPSIYPHKTAIKMKEAEPNNKVLLGMSGGTDSSVAALLLQDAGYEVTGITFRFYEKGNDTEYLEDARTLCERLGIPHLTYDVRGTFRKTIIDYFINEYMAGHTPVPCTLCNNYLKWPLLKRISDEMGIYHFATGHYVRRRLINGYYHITTGADPDKDQSFFLWGLPQEILQRMLLPMGNLTKARVREIAAERGF